MNINRIVGDMLADAENKSWEKEERIYYSIAKNAGANGRLWLMNDIQQRSEKRPNGITETEALSVVGARVYKITMTKERIK